MDGSIHHLGREGRQHGVMRTDVRYRVAVAGAELRMLVLSAGPLGCVGVDLDSGAFVRAQFPAPTDQPLAPLDMITAAMGEPLDPPDPRPEAVQLDSVPKRLGRLAGKRAVRWLTPLHHPRNQPLLGFTGASIPYWTLSGDRPSLALVVPESSPKVVLGDWGYECAFDWQGTPHQFPLADQTLTDELPRLGRRYMSASELARVLGYKPGRLLVVLSEPRQGYCCKEVAALLPGP
jgi:hypothetical protein